MPEQPLPPGATAIDIEELFAAIGELYFQARALRKVVARLQPESPSSPNGVDSMQHVVGT